MAPLAVLLLLTAAIPEAGALDFHFVWQPGQPTGVNAYRVHVREEGRAFGTPVSVGLPAAASDGTMTADLTGLDAGPR